MAQSLLFLTMKSCESKSMKYMRLLLTKTLFFLTKKFDPTWERTNHYQYMLVSLLVFRKWVNVVRTNDLEGVQRFRCESFHFDSRFDLTRQLTKWAFSNKCKYFQSIQGDVNPWMPSFCVVLRGYYGILLVRDVHLRYSNA